jgi:hypothetical protein
MERLAAADPMRDAEQLTPEEQREAQALLTRLFATPTGPDTAKRRARRPRVRRWALAGAVVACSAAAAFAAINLVDSDAPGTGVVDRAVAAVTRNDVVYHVLERTRATAPGTPQGGTFYFESWHTSDGRMHRKVFAARGGRSGRLLEEFAGRRRPRRTSGPALRYDPRENTITKSGFGRAPDADAVADIDPFGDPGAQLRALQEQGRLRLGGTTRVGGRRAYRLASDSTTRWRSFAFDASSTWSTPRHTSPSPRASRRASTPSGRTGCSLATSSTSDSRSTRAAARSSISTHTQARRARPSRAS